MPWCVESDLNPLFKASLDGISIDGTKEVVEIKCPCLKVYENIIREKTNSKEFRLYYGQVQWQMLVADTDKAILFIYFRGKRPLQIKIKRNEAYIIKAQQAALKFWSLVQSNVPPELTGQDSIVYDVQESVQDEWLSLATKYLELETIVNAKKADIANDSNRLGELKNELIKLIPIESNSIQKSGVKVTKSERQGRVDLTKIERFFLDKNLIVSLDDFRGETTTSYRISTYKETNSNTQFEQNPKVSNTETTKNNGTTKNVDPVVVEDITEIEAQKNEIQITDPKTFFEKEINRNFGMKRNV
ncbi:YqaJ viral recombinase family protein [Photobacterium damselae]|uniref:YqaJ viral recombinase family protein n=1 Tax=Photobacterium damselae TaxID=38293 RepID=UPI004067CE9F